jgi:hypothetical protein
MMSAKLAPMDCQYPWSPRRCLRIETNLCPKVPDDFEQARVDAVMEEYGWPDMDIDDHSSLDEESERWMSDWEANESLYDIMESDLFDEDDLLAHVCEGDDDYDDEPYEAMHPYPSIDNSTYDDWYD